jgi:hypothetical protein
MIGSLYIVLLVLGAGATAAWAHAGGRHSQSSVVAVAQAPVAVAVSDVEAGLPNLLPIGEARPSLLARLKPALGNEGVQLALFFGVLTLLGPAWWLVKLNKRGR